MHFRPGMGENYGSHQFLNWWQQYATGILRYNFSSPLYNEILAFARMKSAMQMKSSAMPQMKLNPPIRRRAGFHPCRGFHRRRRFIPPVRVDLAEKTTVSIKTVVFSWYTGRDSTPHPSEPESDALSIEPPVHRSTYYSRIFTVCKGENSHSKGENFYLSFTSPVVFLGKLCYTCRNYGFAPRKR